MITKAKKSFKIYAFSIKMMPAITGCYLFRSFSSQLNLNNNQNNNNQLNIDLAGVFTA